MKFYWKRSGGPFNLFIKVGDGQIQKLVLLYPIFFLGLRLRIAKWQIGRIRKKLAKHGFSYKT